MSLTAAIDTLITALPPPHVPGQPLTPSNMFRARVTQLAVEMHRYRNQFVGATDEEVGLWFAGRYDTLVAEVEDHFRKEWGHEPKVRGRMLD